MRLSSVTSAPLTQTLYVATSNAGKLRDFALVASRTPFSLIPLPNIRDLPVPEENADTFLGNAVLKAVAYSQAARDRIVLADDSGLEVDALEGSPGIYSARFAAREGFCSAYPSSTDALNNACLLNKMEGIPTRTVRYRCVITAARNGQPLTTSAGALLAGFGVLEGTLLAEPRGSSGFGYDPLFLLPALHLTMAEISQEVRSRVSHRAKAIRHLLSLLASSCSLS